MRILISTNYKGSWPYIPEMVKEFNKKGIVCDVYDTSECKLIYNNLQSERYIINKYLLLLLTRLPKVRSYIRKYLHKQFFKKFKLNYDIHTIHYIQLFYSDILKIIQEFSYKTVCVAWGSDIYRIRNIEKIKLCNIINNADNLVATKPMINFIEKNLCKKKIGVKTENLFVVSKSIDNLKLLTVEETVEYSKEKLNIPTESFVITFGYNANCFQQHEFFLETLARVHSTLPNNSFILLPMTYGENRSNYIKEINTKLINLKIKFRIFDNFLNIHDILRIRRISDITINIQKSDALSSSIREHLFTNKPVIVGDWLPYSVFEEMGIFFIRTSLNEFENKLMNVILHYDEIKIKCNNNDKIIYESFSFDKNIDRWIDFYKSITK